MDIDACFQLGYVIKAHGLKGEVQVFLDTDIPENYKNMESVFIEIDNKLVPFFIEAITLNNNKAVVKFEDIDTLEQAQYIKGKLLFLPIEHLPQLNDDQFYYHELIGFKVNDKHMGMLGIVKNIYTLPNQDLIAMHYKDKEVLIPVNDAVIVRIDRYKKELVVEMPQGLLDVYMED